MEKHRLAPEQVTSNSISLFSTHSTNPSRKIKTLTLPSVLLFLTIASFPLYLLPSGGLQISHGFFVLFLLSFLRYLRNWRPYVTPKASAVFRVTARFVGIVCVVQIAYVFILDEPRILQFAAYYVFNFVYFFGIYVYLRVYKDKGLNVVFIGTIAAIALVFVGMLAGVSSESYRKTSFFNNPNQLGYFSLLATIIVLLFHTRSKLKYARVLAICAVIINLYLAMESLSKAAMVAVAASVVLFVPLLKRNELIAIFLTVICSAPFWIDKVAQSTTYERAFSRLEDLGRDHDDNLAGRGYDRILNEPLTLLFGAGEGDYGRFRSSSRSMELHSTFGSIVFCYGIAGTVAFCVFNYRSYRIAPILYCTLFIPVFAYGITHNGIRFSYMWLLYGLFLYLTEQNLAAVSSLHQPTIHRDGNRLKGYVS